MPRISFHSNTLLPAGEPVTPEWLVKAFGPRTMHSVWQVRYAEAAGTPASAEQIHRWSDEGTQVQANDLISVLESGVQLIDGKLIARDVEQGEPWVLIRAVDSTWWDVESDARDVVEVIARQISRAEILPSEDR